MRPPLPFGRRLMGTGPLPYDPQKGLGEAVRQLRREAGMSQRDLAQRVGISASWISRIESGQYDPSWGNMRRVAEGLGISLETLSEIAEDFEEKHSA